MFDGLSGVDNERFENTSKHLAIYLSAVVQILINKKIITEEEFHKYILNTEEIIEKQFSEVKKQRRKEFEEKYPKLSKAVLEKE
jgi:hypothetical protein